MVGKDLHFALTIDDNAHCLADEPADSALVCSYTAIGATDDEVTVLEQDLDVFLFTLALPFLAAGDGLGSL